MADETRNNSDPKHDPERAERSNAAKDPSDWVTGDEPMTGARASYLKTLSEETGEAFDPDLSKAAASRRIDELKSRDPRLNPTGRENKSG